MGGEIDIKANLAQVEVEVEADLGNIHTTLLLIKKNYS